MVISKGQEIQQIEIMKPHLVILGAGASRASFPHGDRNERILPLMDDFIDILNLSPTLGKTNIEYTNNNFESVYSMIYDRKEYDSVRQELEKAVSDYFSLLEISNSPCIYDYLVLSLRGKDVIATFNWDPFLIQAYLRNKHRFKLPHLLFLHGNVAIGFCIEDRELGINGNICSGCGKTLMPTKLLYPISLKDYHNDPVISDQWRQLEFYMKNAFMVTIFGYSAPTSDASAVDLLKKAWGNSARRYIEEIEIIDTKNEEVLRKTWSPFIYKGHFQTYSDFYDSWIAKHPRRTGEAFINKFVRNIWYEDNPFPFTDNFDLLWQWFDVLHKVELRND